ncbi:MAG: hypothetical protein V7752_10100 [Halopseudomonas sp.]
MKVLSYFAQLNAAKQLLWCYLIWYGVMCGFYFDPELALWGRSLGLGGVVGFALMLSTGPISLSRLGSEPWQLFRLFACPFLVSSFSSLIKDKGFLLLLSPHATQNWVAFASCLLFVALCFVLKKMAAEKATAESHLDHSTDARVVS